jgi:hypothetical protein
MSEYAIIRLPTEIEISRDGEIDPGNPWDRVLEGTASLARRSILEMGGPLSENDLYLVSGAAYAACAWMLIMMKKESLLKELGQDSSAWDGAG